MKTCTACQQPKPLDDFQDRQQSRDKKRATCRKCTTAKQQEWSRANPERAQSRHKKWRKSNLAKCNAAYKRRRQQDPLKYRAADRLSYARNATKKAQQARDRRAANAEAYNQMVRDRRAANPDISRAAHGNRRAREIGGKVTRADICAQLRSQGARCYYCWEDVSTKYQVDHFVALASGGKHDPSNIVIACANCNRRKNKFDGFEYFHKIGVRVEPLRLAA